MTNFIVKRSEWVRGEYSQSRGVSALLNSVGNKCCLGFCALQLGMKEQEIKGELTPVMVRNWPDKSFLDLSIRHNAVWVCEAVGVNDDIYINDHAREEKLQQIFTRGGHTISFID